MAIEHNYSGQRPHSTCAMHNLGFLYEKQNESELAEKYYLMAYAMKDLARLYKKQNKLDLAEKY